MNYDKACEWFDEKVEIFEQEYHEKPARLLTEWIDEFEGLECEHVFLNHEVDSERIAELVYEIVHDRHSTDSDKTEYLSNLARALALHASIHYLFEKIGKVKL